MDTNLDESIELALPKSDCLLLFELLTQSYKEWRKNNPDDSSSGPMAIEATEFAQRRAVWHLEGALERTLPEIFSSNYSSILDQAKQKLESES